MKANKKDPSKSEESLLVSLIESNWNLICEEILRWDTIMGGKRGTVPIPTHSGT